MALVKIKTPCVGRCSTVYGDIICRGCKRFVHEVDDWNRYDNQQKKAVWNRLDQLFIQVMQQKIYIVDVDLLQSSLIRFSVMFDPDQHAYHWVYKLLQIAAHAIAHIEDCGLQLHPNLHQTSLKQLKNQIDADFYQLSQAHYDRYFSSSASQLIF